MAGSSSGRRHAGPCMIHDAHSPDAVPYSLSPCINHHRRCVCMSSFKILFLDDRPRGPEIFEDCAPDGERQCLSSNTGMGTGTHRHSKLNVEREHSVLMTASAHVRQIPTLLSRLRPGLPSTLFPPGAQVLRRQVARRAGVLDQLVGPPAADQSRELTGSRAHARPGPA